MRNLEQAARLDKLTGPVQRVVRRLPRPARDALHGVWLGHPLHPVLVQVPAGAWLSASLLDARPGHERASRGLALVGLAAVGPAWATGANDWSELHEQQMRVGLVHAAAVDVAAGLYAASVLASGRTAKGLRLAGLAVAGVGGYLGGHMAYRQSAGANQAEPVPHLVSPGWHDLMPADELAGLAFGQPAKRMLGDIPVVVIHDHDGLHVLAERCSHLSGPLSDGDYADGCLTCPWHGTAFRAADGAVVHGPATAPQPVFQTRVTEGALQVRLAGAG